MLRTLGASSRQVLGAVLAEAALIGVLASALGIAGGFVFVELIKLMFGASGFELPVTEPPAHASRASSGPCSSASSRRSSPR